MTSLMLKIMTPLLAIFGLGGSKSNFSRFGFVPERHVGPITRFGKVVRYRREAPVTRFGRYRTQPARIWLSRWRKAPKYRIMRWRRYDETKAGKCPYRVFRWRRYDAALAGQPKMRQPGFNWRNIPLLDKTHHVSDATVVKPMELTGRKVQLSDRTFFHVSASIRYRIIDPDTVSFRLEHFETQLKQRCETLLLEVLSKRSSEQLQKLGQINGKLLKRAGEIATDFGIEFDYFGLQQNEPTAHTEVILQRRRLITETADAVKDNASKLSGLSPAAIVGLTGGSLIANIEAVEGVAEDGGKVKDATVLSLVQPDTSTEA